MTEPISETLGDWLKDGHLAKLLAYPAAERIKGFKKASEQIRTHYRHEHEALGKHFFGGTLFDTQRRFFQMYVTGPGTQDIERANRALQVLALYGEDKATNAIYRYINRRIFGLPMSKYKNMAEGSDEWNYERRRFDWMNESEGWLWA